jgi:predicted metal-dependent hydrolase
VARRASAAHAGTSTANAAPERGSVEHAGTAIEYEVVRSARRRRTLQLTVDGHGVRVSAPLRTPRREIEEFVRGRSPWILKHRRTVLAPLTYATGETMPFQGVALPLFVTESRVRGVTVTRGLFDLHVTVPARYDAARRTTAIANALARWYAERAQEAVEASVARWAPVTGRWPKRVLVRNQRQRWGSCSPDGTLRFNWRLIMLDPSLLDYVVVHELAHLEVPSHGPAFWSAVARLLPDHAARRRRMREAAANLPAL